MTTKASWGIINTVSVTAARNKILTAVTNRVTEP